MPSSPSDPGAYDPAAGEKLIIETPEQTSIEFPLAGIGSRFLAVLIDSLIQGAVAFALGLILVALGFGFRSAGFGPSPALGVWLVAILILVYFLLMYGYFMLFESIWNGQTPGKRLLGIRVVRDGGYPIDLGSSVLRNLVRVVEATFSYVPAAVSALISAQNKRLGDFAAGTIVVRDRAFEMSNPQTWLQGDNLPDTPPLTATTMYCLPL